MMLSPAVEYRLDDQALDRSAAFGVERGTDQHRDVQCPFDPSSRLHELPTLIAHHRFVRQAGQRQQTVEQRIEHARRRVLAVAVAGAVFQPLEFALQRPDDEPRVDRQLVADDVDRLEHVPNRVGDGARALVVDDEREQLVGRVVEERRRIVADEARDRCR